LEFDYVSKFYNGIAFVKCGARWGILKNPIYQLKRAYIKEFVTRLYELTLSRKPDQKGLDYWTGELFDNRRTGANVSENFIFSKEFIEKDISNSDFIDMMYRIFFNREADEEGRKYWLNKLEEGYSRRYILSGFVDSIEFKGICNEYGITSGRIKLTPEDTKPNASYKFSAD